MEDLSKWESKNFLLATAKRVDPKITERMITRWHYEGLLPKPRQRSLGRGRGTETIYPTGTAMQLVALLQYRKEKRDISYIAWRMWWDGYEIEMNTIRELLRATVREW